MTSAFFAFFHLFALQSRCIHWRHKALHIVPSASIISCKNARALNHKHFDTRQSLRSTQTNKNHFDANKQDCFDANKQTNKKSLRCERTTKFTSLVLAQSAEQFAKKLMVRLLHLLRQFHLRLSLLHPLAMLLCHQLLVLRARVLVFASF